MRILQKIITKISNSNREPTTLFSQRGQSIIILTFAFLGLLAMLGLALDLGLVYIERVRLKRTVDAAALAAVSELPTEEEAAITAISYLRQNGYNVDESYVYIAGCVQDVHGLYQDGVNYGFPETTPPTGNTDDIVNRPFNSEVTWGNLTVTSTLSLSPALFYPYINPAGGGEATFYIDMRSYQARETNGTDPACDTGQRVSGGAGSFGSANKIKITGFVPVRMNFMQFFGFSTYPVSDQAVGQSASSLDVALVLDTTGSMDFDTICYGCWYRCDQNEINNLGLSPQCPTTSRYKPYPKNGWAMSYAYTGTVMQRLIYSNATPSTILPPDTVKFAKPGPVNCGANCEYVLHEAEFYSNLVNSPWDPGQRTVGQGYWAMQRLPEANAYSIDGYGQNYNGTSTNSTLSGFVRHHPHEEFTSGGAFGRNYTLAEARQDIPPRLEYDFIPDWTGNTNIHIRAIYYNRNNNSPRNQFFWGIVRVETDGSETPIPIGGFTVNQAIGGGDGGTFWIPTSTNWNWFRIPQSVDLTANRTMSHILKIWAGSAGYEIDRIVITNQSTINSTIQQSSATPGSAQRMAADPCNPIFGLTINNPALCSYVVLGGTVNNLEDPLFDARNPMRGAMEAMRRFVQRLDPQLDQAGFVDFATCLPGWGCTLTSATQRAQMECIRATAGRSGTTGAPANQVTNYPFNPNDGYPNYDEYNCSQISTALDTWASIPGNCPGYPDNHDEFECFSNYYLANPTETVPIKFAAVLRGIENAYPPGGGTNIAGGLRRGLHLLAINTDGGTTQNKNCQWNQTGSLWQIKNGGGWIDQPHNGERLNPTDHCSRGQAATPIIVLLTDGEPNQEDDLDNACKSWLSQPGNSIPYEGFDTSNPYECILYYTEIAANNGIIIYSIGLGTGVDQQLLNHIAQTTKGQYYFAPSAAQLDLIFDQILANVYIRLIQ